MLTHTVHLQLGKSKRWERYNRATHDLQKINCKEKDGGGIYKSKGLKVIQIEKNGGDETLMSNETFLGIKLERDANN